MADDGELRSQNLGPQCGSECVGAERRGDGSTSATVIKVDVTVHGTRPQFAGVRSNQERIHVEIWR